MHLPDGFVSVPVTLAAGTVSAIGVAGSLKILRRKMPECLVPRMAVMAAFIFAAQMFNFPVSGGTSGHLIGGFLASVLFGPAAAILIMSCVLIVQALVFQDGGLLAVLANIANMAVLGVLVGYGLYEVFRKVNEAAAIFIGGWISVVVATAACSVELVLSGTVSAKAVFPAMLGVHAIIGIAEGIITLIVVKSARKAGFGCE